ncbi:MAG: polyprenyl synthetase family protein [Cyanobacteria bacterium J06592_8]
MPIENAAELLIETVDSLSRRAPGIVASAAHQLGNIVVGLHFGDGSNGELRAEQSRLIAADAAPQQPEVELYFDNRTMNLLFDLDRKPADQVWEGSYDFRGEREAVLAVWRAFRLLSQRASGLRAVQTLWREYRDQNPQLWGTPAETTIPPRRVRESEWQALEYLEDRYPEDTDRGYDLLGDSVYVDARVLWNGYQSRAWWQLEDTRDADLLETMGRCKERVQAEMMEIIPTNREPREALYDLMREYPNREGKGLRPTLTIATCCALGGAAEDAIRTAAAIELFHNGFLVHDDIADESTHRRTEPTLHEAQGVGLAVNTGDGMNLLAVDSILSNLPTLGLARTLGLIHEVIHMCRESIEGQAIELGWIRNNIVPERDEDYFVMSTKKTGWYTCISPCRMGAICAGETDPQRLDLFDEAFRLIGIAFQIQDDVLNLVGEEELYGKEPLGDLLEGKRTVMLIHLMRTANETVRARVDEILRLPRLQKTQANAEEILEAMNTYGSIDYAVELADRLAHEGVRHFEEDLTFIEELEPKGVLRQIANYVTTRPL